MALATAAAVFAAPARAASWPAPVNLVTPTPIRPVTSAVLQVREHAPFPPTLNSGSPAQTGVETPAPCVPRFGPGLSYQVCHLGATRSRHLVVLLGDSHATMWWSAFLPAATDLDFDLVPLVKPGCAVWALHQDRPGWPCATWYRGVLRTIRRLHPSATVVSFMTANFTASQAAYAGGMLQRVLAAVPHPILLADTPSDGWYHTQLAPPPVKCMSSPAANQGTCALSEAPQVRATLTAIQAMVNTDRYPAIPTLQWFCADDICPAVVSDTVTTEDGNHITPQYIQLLAPRLTNRLRPILHHLWSHGA